MIYIDTTIYTLSSSGDFVLRLNAMFVVIKSTELISTRQPTVEN